MHAMKILQKFINGSVVLEKVESKYNGRITIDEDLFGKKRLLVRRLTQSGPAVEKIWSNVIGKLSNFQIANCLILGLGAGNAAKIINKYFPKAKITGIEIDPEIIKLGKKYFDLEKIQNLSIIIDDALKIPNSHYPLSKFDLVLVDLYLGDCFPKQAEGSQFLESLNKILESDGIVIINRLHFGNHKENTDKFEQKIRKIFPRVEARITDYNNLFLCRK
jgi:spermidine synthase